MQSVKTNDTFEMIIPAVERALLVVRLAVSGALSVDGVDVDRLEDIKAAVSEACYLLIHQPRSCERLHVRMTCTDAIEIEVYGLGTKKIYNEHVRIPAHEDCRLVLESLMDSAEITVVESMISAIRMTAKTPGGRGLCAT